MMAVLPGQLIVGGCVLVRLFSLHDEAHVLVGLAAGLKGKPHPIPVGARDGQWVHSPKPLRDSSSTAHLGEA